MRGRSGFSLIELVVALGLVALLFSGILFSYMTILDIIMNGETRTAATSAMNQVIETIRNLPYEQVGTVGGIPAGIIPETQNLVIGDYTFTLTAVIRNIDDPFDRSITDMPPDMAPSDYKLVSMEINCTSCNRPFPTLTGTFTVAPRNLESATRNGSLFVRVLDASGLPVPSANVHIANTSTTPTIDLNDTTDASGTLALLDVPTSTQSYRITVTKPGFSTDKTYPIGGAGNPNPLVAHATVAEQTITQLTFAIDTLSSLTVRSTDAVCSAQGNMPFRMHGTKAIGANPLVFKFATTTFSTGAQGTYAFPNLEWDAYHIAFTGTADVVGSIPLVPIAVNPTSSHEVLFVLQPADPESLLVTVRNAITGVTVTDADVTVSRSGFSETKKTGRAVTGHTSWAGGAYTTQDGNIDVDSIPGRLTLLAQGGIYSTSTESWLISNTIDFGSSTTSYFSFSWNPGSLPANTTMQFQIATNNDQSTWNFVGPDGTGNTYFSSPGTALHASHNGTRYARYKVFLRTFDEYTTPALDEVSFEFRGACVPPAQALFGGLSALPYDVFASHTGFSSASSTATLGGGTNEINLDLYPL